MRLLTVLLLAFLASAALTSAYIVVGSGEVRERAFLTVLITPLLWAGFMVYAYWDRKAWRPAATCAGIIAVCSALIVAAPPLAP
ncbi:MAG: hypothetical protein AAGI15_09165 [Pseudomonadota bacterium]